MIEILENIASIFKSAPIYEVEIIAPRVERQYVLKIYNRADEDDLTYISNHKKEIKEFMDAGYQNAGLGDFLGCSDAKSVRKNTILMKVAEEKGTGRILVISLYTARFGGVKCAGLTKLVTDELYLNALAKEAVIHIVKEDISHFAEFRWIECSDALEHYWSKFTNDVLRVPTSYLQGIFDDPDFIRKNNITEDDEYHYTRKIGDGTKDVTKCIFGFSKQEILDKFLEERNMTIDELVAKVESSLQAFENQMFGNLPTYVRGYIRVLNYFYLKQEEYGIFEITEHEMEVLENTIELLDKFLLENNSKLNQRSRQELMDELDTAMETANNFAIVKPYELGEDFIPERERYKDVSDQEYFARH